MKVLLLYPRFPKTFWSYDEFMKIAGLKAFIPPLGILTVAAMLPTDWEVRFYDRNVNQETDADWQWCDIVILSAMLAQKEDFLAQIHKAAQLGKKVAVGGPYPTSVPEPAQKAGANYFINSDRINFAHKNQTLKFDLPLVLNSPVLQLTL